jgi:hypothetical protein
VAETADAGEVVAGEAGGVTADDETLVPHPAAASTPTRAAPRAFRVRTGPPVVPKGGKISESPPEAGRRLTGYHASRRARPHRFATGGASHVNGPM